ncbi:hypothetical protein GCM10010967_57700 [Dyadobacter beijingensis]|uniref:Sensor protein n=1 Tax=Dyadobacter beijingensis TaxID=365489 RepID=A0ABQ2ILW2_9BACT|nr:hypothetical protein [Dyadobacter beijingensis]GGN13931.1 hypothetical protein GCM10010967_57700 [Dyadobacter beijingensis]
MIDELIDFHKKELNFYYLVTRKNKTWQTALINASFALAFIFYSLMLFMGEIWYGVWAGVCLVVAACLAKVFNTMTIKRLYPEVYTPWYQPFPRSAFNDMILMKFRKHVEDKKWDDKKWDMIQAAVASVAERQRMSLIIYISAVAALILPVWGIYAVKMISKFDNPPYDLTKGFVTMIMLIIVMAIIPMQVAWMRDHIFSNYGRLTRFNKLITDFRLLV